MEIISPGEITQHFIDIEKVIASKNEHLLKVLPGFIIRYLKRIIHQEEINGSIYNNRDKFGLDFIAAILKEYDIRQEVVDGRKDRTNPEVIPSTGRLLIVSNHPLGGLDGMALMHRVGAVRPDIVFPVNDLLMNVPGLKPLFIPINKHGKNTDNIRILDETFASDKTILYFPAGLVSRKRKGIIHDLEWKKTFITKARKFQRDILPVYVSGRNSNFFYNLANWRRKLGINFNIEMLYLVDEMVKQKGNEIRLIFGDPIPYQTFNRSRSDVRWADYVCQIVYDLADAGKSV